MVFGKSRDNETQWSQKYNFKSQTFIPTMNFLIDELNKRMAAYEKMNKKFPFLFQLAELKF